MKRFVFALAAMLLILSSCEKDPNHYMTKLSGMWMIDEIDGSDVLTDELFVLNFVANGKMLYASGQTTDEGTSWIEEKNFTFSVKRNKIYIEGTNFKNEHCEIILKILSLDKEDFTMTIEKKIINEVNVPDPCRYDFERVDANYYGDAIYGLWEGKCVSDGIGEMHHWLYLETGKFRYFSKKDNKWGYDNDEIATFFIYQDLLCTNWTMNLGTTQAKPTFENWKIELTNNGNKMLWEGEREGGSIVRFELIRVPIDSI